ncbi:shikimate dehydrogenase [Pleomorphomonas diazotrophica]|uniref:Shikimate dehydrogenase (NADP(+)) n=1 Tax=Pleomorphomonas diazotrophica TaxID=1166257 RepID=A0A1I4SX64_9HYPH|nr:shikimate dehydrogenase [Pleomorphomonas diazotrophica]PKR88597.1 shikimate dehydrogenase [Pleomorphomonas diazotrophica]SFM68995.1 shikimate dehydrogenase [Pleomorphomonas diazotrophica]
MIRAAVIGWPVSHSRSPLIHGHWLTTLDIDGDYRRVAVEPERADAFFARFAESGLAGGNVTIPYKEIAARAAHHREPVVERIGAANTLWIENGVLCADNTDGIGFLANLDERAPGWDRASGEALVLGAGGAAAAVVDALVERGFMVRIVNRTLSRAEALAGRYPGRASADVLSATNRYAATAGFLVNTTSLGMKGEGTIDLDMTVVPAGSVVTDIVYVPLVTPFLAAAAARGLPIVDGLGMLLHQAVPGFTRWFGHRPTVTPELRELIEADL